MSLPFDPPSSTPSSSPFDVLRRAAWGGFALAIPITTTMTQEPCRGPYLRTSLSSSSPFLHSTRAGRPVGVYIVTPQTPIPGPQVAWVHVCYVFTQWRLLETYLP